MNRAGTVFATALGLSLAACTTVVQPAVSSPSLSIIPSPSPVTISVAGRLVIYDRTLIGSSNRFTPGVYCIGDHADSDIAAGTQVIVMDDAGATLAITQLGSGGSGGQGSFACIFPFSASVPAGKRFYGIKVAQRGVTKLPEAEMARPVLTIR